VFEQLGQEADELRGMSSASADFLGYIARSADGLRTAYRGLADNGAPAEVIQSGFAIGESILGQIKEYEPNIASFFAKAKSAATNTADACYTANFSITVYSPGTSQVSWARCPLLESATVDQIASKLERIDPSLASSYRQAWSSYYGSHHDGQRSALFQLRQAFEHFFALLAPDDLVRNSGYFSKKPEKGKEDQIHRTERYRYVANRHISDPARRTVLIESANQTIENYERLNLLHKRGELPFEKAKAALTARQRNSIRGCVRSAFDGHPFNLVLANQPAATADDAGDARRSPLHLRRPSVSGAIDSSAKSFMTKRQTVSTSENRLF
jgi:hypothetical protein